MGNTYDTSADADADRAQLQQLLRALDAWDRALRRDECAAWCIAGTRGSIHTWGDGKTWLMWVPCRSARHWTATKQRLAFCELTQDGDDEGCFRLHGLPTAGQVAEIRAALGIRKRRELSEEERERLRATAFKPGARYGAGSGARTAGTV